MTKKMQPVITAEDARKITGGRTPLVPVEYEEAVKALAACINLDDAKRWNDKADALAAWAKIYRNDEAGRQAAALKLHAYRRMGALAEELRPRKWRVGEHAVGRDGKKRGKGSFLGPLSILVENGLSMSQATAARSISKIPEAEFDSIVRAPIVPAVTRLRARYASDGRTSDSWKALHGNGEKSSIGGFRLFCQRSNARLLASGLSKDEAAKMRETIHAITEWLDEFEQHLPRASE